MQTKNKRDDVIQATLEIIAENGFHNAPTSLIAKRANVGMGTIYRYFKSKDELIHAIYSERINIAKERVLSDYDTSTPLRERYIKLCRNFFDYMINNPLDYVFFEQYRNSPYGLKEQSENIQGFEHGERPEDYPLLQLFTEGQEMHVIKEMKLPLLVSLTMGNIFTLARHWVSDALNIEDKEINQFFIASWDSVSL
jgi:AcrR family transcriptional regulator